MSIEFDQDNFMMKSNVQILTLLLVLLINGVRAKNTSKVQANKTEDFAHPYLARVPSY